MELPNFKYSPNAYELDIFEKKEGICSICEQTRNLKYTSSFYCTGNPEYICPWCIENGKAAEKYKGVFNDYFGIEGVNYDEDSPTMSETTLDKDLLLKITNMTPSYTSWQQEVWLTHCKEPCAFIGYADKETIKPYLEELKDDIESNEGYGAEVIKTHLSKNGSLVGYLFQCTICGNHRLHVDCD
jgi:uncharacterized protein